MTKFQKSPALQLVIIISFYFGFGVLVTVLDAFISPALTGYSITSLADAESSSPNVVAAWKLFAVTDTILMVLLPALLFARWASPRPLAWLRLDKPLRLWPVLFVVVIVLAALPVRGFLYDWNCTWSPAKESVHGQTRANAIIEMPNFVSLPIGLLLFAAIPAIARVCFFFGMMQQTLIRMMPKAPWIAILITSVIFSACFFDWDWFVPLIFIGVLLGAVYYLSENLWLSILGLFIFMSADWVKSYLVQHGLIKGDPLTPSHTPWYMALIGLLIMAGLVWYIRKRIPKPVVVVNDYQEDIDLIGNGKFK
jgi:hypothetical protein